MAATGAGRRMKGSEKKSVLPGRRNRLYRWRGFSAGERRKQTGVSAFLGLDRQYVFDGRFVGQAEVAEGLVGNAAGLAQQGQE